MPMLTWEQIASGMKPSPPKLGAPPPASYTPPWFRGTGIVQNPHFAPLGAPTNGPLGAPANRPKPPGPPVGSLQWMMNRLMQSGLGETPAQQEARAQRMAKAEYDRQHQLLIDDYNLRRDDAMRLMQAQAAAGQAAAAMNKDLFGAVGGEYNAAAKEIKGLASGLTAGTGALTRGDTAAANAGLSAVGGGGIKEGGLFGTGGGTQQGVENYRGGTIPGDMLGTQGEAQNFGLAGMANSLNLRATQEAQFQLMSTMHEADVARTSAIKALVAGQPQVAAAYLQQLQNAQAKSVALYQGIQAQQAATIKQAQQDSFKDRAAAQRAANSAFRQGLGRFVVIQNKDGSWSPQFAGKIPAKPAKVTIKTIPGQGTWVVDSKGNLIRQLAEPAGNYQAVPGGYFDKNTHTYHHPDGSPMAPPSKTATKKGALTDLQVKTQIESWYNGKTGTAKVAVQIGTDKSGNPIYRDMKPGDVFQNADGSTHTVPGAPSKGKITYQAALRKLIALGRDPLESRNLLNAYWGRGERGRPYLSAEERTVLRANGKRGAARQFTPAQATALVRQHPDLANRVSDGYLTAEQMGILTSKGASIPGIWIPGSFVGRTQQVFVPNLH